ncbi:MAG: HNH endonuclease [Polyangiaceae bacterium]|nr:HNH endonuclease [Polyangiaceae bacterium]
MATWLRFLWAASVLVLKSWRCLLGAVCGSVLVVALFTTNAWADVAPVEVCWRPNNLSPEDDTFVMFKDTKGWREVGAWRGTRTDHHIVYKHNPNLGTDSLNRFPEDIRKIAWTCKRAPAVQPPPAADPPPPPPPPPKPPPPKKVTPKPQVAPRKADGPKPLPKPIARSAQKPAARQEQPRKAPSALPGSERLLPKDEQARVLPDAKDASPLPRPSLSHFAVNCADEKARCKRDVELMPAELRATLAAILAQSCRDNARPDPRHVGQTYRDPLQEIETKLLIAALRWAGEQLAEPHVVPPQPREILPLPKLVVQKPVADEALSLEDPRVQFGGGLVSGGAIGAVPLGSAGAEVAIQLRLLPKGTYWAQVGRACGEIVVGTGQIAIGCAGMGAGAGMSSTGGGAIVGVPIAAGSFAIATNGCATLGNGVRNVGQLLSEGAPPDAPPAPSQVKLLEPKAKPAAQAPVAAAPKPAAKPAAQAPPAAPTKTTTTTRIRGAPEQTTTTTTSPSGTRTTTRPRQPTPNPGNGRKPHQPDPDKWTKRGGTIKENADGTRTFTRKDGVAVTYDKHGYPDFSAYRHPTVKDVRIEFTGKYGPDKQRANAAAGIPKEPLDYIWHHHQDGKTMQLIRRDVHEEFFHTGGMATSR